MLVCFAPVVGSGVIHCSRRYVLLLQTLQGAVLIGAKLNLLHMSQLLQHSAVSYDYGDQCHSMFVYQLKAYCCVLRDVSCPIVCVVCKKKINQSQLNGIQEISKQLFIVRQKNIQHAGHAAH